MSACSHKQTQSARQLDQRMSNSGLFYVRFMDDILVLSPTRWKLRKAVKAINEVPGSLRMEKTRKRPSLIAGSTAKSWVRCGTNV